MLCIKGVHLFFFKHLQDIFTTVVTKKKSLRQWLQILNKLLDFLSQIQLEYNSVFLLFSCPVDINYMRLTIMNTNQELQGWMGHPPIQSNTP